MKVLQLHCIGNLTSVKSFVYGMSSLIFEAASPAFLEDVQVVHLNTQSAIRTSLPLTLAPATACSRLRSQLRQIKAFDMSKYDVDKLEDQDYNCWVRESKRTFLEARAAVLVYMTEALSNVLIYLKRVKVVDCKQDDCFLFKSELLEDPALDDICDRKAFTELIGAASPRDSAFYCSLVGSSLFEVFIRMCHSELVKTGSPASNQFIAFLDVMMACQRLTRAPIVISETELLSSSLLQVIDSKGIDLDPMISICEAALQEYSNTKNKRFNEVDMLCEYVLYRSLAHQPAASHSQNSSRRPSVRKASISLKESCKRSAQSHLEDSIDSSFQIDAVYDLRYLNRFFSKHLNKNIAIYVRGEFDETQSSKGDFFSFSNSPMLPSSKSKSHISDYSQPADTGDSHLSAKFAILKEAADLSDLL